MKEAAPRVRAALALDDQQLLARWIGAEVDRSEGRLEKAERGYHWLVDFYNDHDVKRAESLRWIGLAAAQYARWRRLSDQFDFLVNELYPDALKLDPAYWPAHYEAGLLFLEKYNEADAAREFKAALELNPQAAEVHAALAALALENHNFEEAEASLHRALEINPRLLTARQIEADLAWLNLEVPETLRLLEEKVLPLNPVDEETLGRIAACYVVLEEKAGAGRTSRLQRLIAEVTGRNPHAGDFFYALAGMLEERNKQADAEAYFREAIRVMPQEVGPQAGLGLLYMRMGREEEARRVLKEAFEADPFHIRVKNNLDVLDVIDKLAVVRTAHFVVKYDAKADKQLGRYAVRHMETVYPELCKLFGYQPPERPLIEIFNVAEGLDGHQWFSADDRHAVPGHGGGLHRRHGGDGLAQRFRRAGAVQLGPCAQTRALARHHAAADEVQHSALVHGRAGRLVRGLSAAADLERDAPGPRAAGKALQPANAQWRLRPPVQQ